MKRIPLLAIVSFCTVPALAQHSTQVNGAISDAHEISYAVVRASQLQYLNTGDVQGLRKHLTSWVASDARALAARVLVPGLATPDERTRSLRALRLIAALHERFPISQITSDPDTLEGFEKAKADNPCEFKLNQSRDWGKPIASITIDQCKALGN